MMLSNIHSNNSTRTLALTALTVGGILLVTAFGATVTSKSLPRSIKDDDSTDDDTVDDDDDVKDYNPTSSLPPKKKNSKSLSLGLNGSAGQNKSLSTQPSNDVSKACVVDGAKSSSTTTTTTVAESKTAPAVNSVVMPSTSSKAGSIRVVVMKAYGFQVKRKRGPFKKNDVPDMYCAIRFGSDPKAFRSKTVKDSTTPSWNMFRDYPYTSPNQAINVDVYKENKRRKDDLVGTAQTTVSKVLLFGGGRLDVEILLDGKKTGTFVTLGCSMI